MLKILNTIVALSALAATAACTSGQTPVTEGNAAGENTSVASQAAARTPVKVVEDHVAAMKTGDLELIMKDYDENTVVITPQGLVADQAPSTGPGVYSGIDNARKVFATLTNEQNIGPVSSMVTRVEPHGDDGAFLYWTQLKGTPQEASGTDVFVVRNDKVVFQDIIPDAK